MVETRLNVDIIVQGNINEMSKKKDDQKKLQSLYEERERKVDPSHYIGNVIFCQYDSTGRYFWYFRHMDVQQEVAQMSQALNLKATLTFERRTTPINIFWGSDVFPTVVRVFARWIKGESQFWDHWQWG